MLLLSLPRAWTAAVVALALVATACATGADRPAPSTSTPVPATLIPPRATVTPSPPAATPTPAPAPEPPPPPTVAPIPRVARIAVSAAISDDDARDIYRGAEVLFTVAGFKPAERIAVQIARLGESPPRPFFVRAGDDGSVTWDWPTGDDAPGLFGVRLQGGSGPARSFAFQVVELDLPATEFTSLGTLFSLYRTPEARIFSYPSIPRSLSALTAQRYREGLAIIEKDLRFTLSDGIDVYLAPDSNSLVKEVEAGGAKDVAGFEAGISLYGYPRSGVYIDVSGAPLSGLAHVVAHELVHQITARIEGPGGAPVWFIEGLAEVEGFKAGLNEAGDKERHWRRVTRNVVRRALRDEAWIDLATVGEYETWQKESALSRLELMYGQAYASVDYIARVYGDAVLRPLLERLAAAPKELDAVFAQVLGIPFAAFQERVRQSVGELDDYERRIESLIGYARAIFGLEAQAAQVSDRWNGYLLRRSSLSRAQRAAVLRPLLDDYLRLQAQLEALAPPAEAAQVHATYRASFAGYVRATQAFLRLESSGETEQAAVGNAALNEANALIEAARDRLTALLDDSGVGVREV